MTGFLNSTPWRLFVDAVAVVSAFMLTYLALREGRDLRYKKRLRFFLLLYKTQKDDVNRVVRSARMVLGGEVSTDATHTFTWDRSIFRQHDMWKIRAGVTAYGCAQEGNPAPATLAEYATATLGLKRLDSVTIKPNQGKSPAREWPVGGDRSLTRLLPEPSIGLAQNLKLFTDDKAFNAPSFGLAELPAEPYSSGPVFRIRTAHYFDFIDTCLGFGYEATKALVAPKSGFPLRKKYAVGELDNRHAQIGVVSMIVFVGLEVDAKFAGSNSAYRSGGKINCFILHRRSSDVSEASGLVNVAPAGTFQPEEMPIAGGPAAGAQEDIQFGFLDTLTREFYEEIYGKPEFSELTNSTVLRGDALWQLFRKSSFYLGMVFNPFDLHVEVLTLTLLDVTDPEVRRLFPKPARAADAPAEDAPVTVSALRKTFVGSSEGGVELVPFSDAKLQHYRNEYRSTTAFGQICSLLLDNKSAGGSLTTLIPHGPATNGGKPPAS